MNYQIIEKLIPTNEGIRYKKEYMTLTPKGVCWHWTANEEPTAGAENHWSYWHSAIYGAHYVVDQEKIIHCVPDTEVVWHAGPSTEYTDFIKSHFGNAANLSLVGVELCVNANWPEVYKRAVWLGAYFCMDYGWDPYKDFFRHYDCTRKDCPRMWTPYVEGGDDAWQKFLQDVALEIKMQERSSKVEDTEKWQAEMGINAILELNTKDLLSKPEYWVEKIGEKTPNWLFFEMVRRLNERIEKS